MRLCLLASIGAALGLLSGCGGEEASSRVVVYCALDKDFSEPILEEFSRRAGLKVVPRYDTEANKSVGLFQDLLREQSRPRCDVHWNNEILATVRLQKQGLLAPYRSPAAAPFPEAARAADGSWTAFAARARVLIVSTEKVPKKDWPKSLEDLLQPQWKGRIAMAKPQFGTTATQAACLFQAWGDEAARKFFHGLRDNGVNIVAGNKQVAVAVGQGRFELGLTDTDDAYAELDAGRPVAILFPDHDAPADRASGTLFIPNTVAIIKDCPNPKGARQLVDYLLSPEVEEKLARCASRQIPLNPQVKIALPKEIQQARAGRWLPVDFGKAADGWDRVQAFLRNEFARP